MLTHLPLLVCRHPPGSVSFVPHRRDEITALPWTLGGNARPLPKVRCTMTRTPLLTLLLLATVHAGNAAELPAGFTALFNDKDLTGWWGLSTEDPAKWRALSAEQLAAKKQASLADIAKHWKVENGELVNDGNGLYLTTDADYGDIDLRLDYKTVAGADSGIYLRAIPQVQIWDTTEAGGKWNIGADKGSGGLWNNAKGSPGRDPLAKADKAFGEWNAVRIVMVGERVTVWLNDQRVVDHARMQNYFAKDKAMPRSGPIQLQTHGGEIRWRKVIVRSIPGDEANAILAANGPDKPKSEDFPSIFNGKDFSGWKGPVENYQITDGVITCLPGKGGTIFTDTIYRDFTARIEFRLPEGGNNGLALRYPGTGDTAYTGMCELQVLDNDSPKYDKLDVRQYHGSAYGMAAAQRGYLRPTGQWNFQEVTVRGSTIRVELNGTQILDADLSKVTEFMGNSPHPGKDRTEGHFGLAGHNDPVAFRNLRIKAH